MLTEKHFIRAQKSGRWNMCNRSLIRPRKEVMGCRASPQTQRTSSCSRRRTGMIAQASLQPKIRLRIFRLRAMRS